MDGESTNPQQFAPLLTEPLPWEPRTSGIPRRDFFVEFIITVVVPSAVALVMFIILSVLLFGRREGREKRDRETSETQLMQYYSIRQASNNLRYMSAQREVLPSVTPRLGRTPAGTPAPSLHNTLSRPDRVSPRACTPPSQAPPPYRPPPTFPTDGASGWQNGVEPVAMETQNNSDQDEEFVPHGTPETLKVRK